MWIVIAFRRLARVRERAFRLLPGVFAVAYIMAQFFVFPAAAQAKPECDIKEFYELNKNAYYACAEMPDAVEKFTGTCLKEVKTGEYWRMARICFMCGLVEDENCMKYIEGYKAPAASYNDVRYLEAIYYSREDEVLRQLALLEKAAHKDNPDTWRRIAAGYEVYGDQEKAIAILEYYIKEFPEFLRVANDLAFAYLNAGNFDKAAYYADYYRRGDKSWPGPEHVLAEIAYYKGDLEGAIEHLKTARDTGSFEALAPFIEGKLLSAEGRFKEAYRAYAEVASHYPVAGTYGNNHWKHDFANFFMELFERSEGELPGIDTLEETTKKLSEENEYYEAAKHYYLCFIMNPEKHLNLYNTARMLEMSGNVEQAVSYYSIFLALEPDTDASEQINEFLASRRTEPFSPSRMACLDIKTSNVCNSGKDSCYWNESAGACYGKETPCDMYKNSDACSSAPAVGECYWNTGMQKCAGREKGCYFYNSRAACQATPATQRCVWISGRDKCVGDTKYEIY